MVSPSRSSFKPEMKITPKPVKSANIAALDAISYENDSFDEYNQDFEDFDDDFQEPVEKKTPHQPVSNPLAPSKLNSKDVKQRITAPAAQSNTSHSTKTSHHRNDQNLHDSVLPLHKSDIASSFQKLSSSSQQRYTRFKALSQLIQFDISHHTLFDLAPRTHHNTSAVHSTTQTEVGDDKETETDDWEVIDSWTAVVGSFWKEAGQEESMLPWLVEERNVRKSKQKNEKMIGSGFGTGKVNEKRVATFLGRAVPVFESLLQDDAEDTLISDEIWDEFDSSGGNLFHSLCNISSHGFLPTDFFSNPKIITSKLFNLTETTFAHVQTSKLPFPPPFPALVHSLITIYSTHTLANQTSSSLKASNRENEVLILICRPIITSLYTTPDTPGLVFGGTSISIIQVWDLNSNSHQIFGNQTERKWNWPVALPEIRGKDGMEIMGLVQKNGGKGKGSKSLLSIMSIDLVGNLQTWGIHIDGQGLDKNENVNIWEGQAGKLEFNKTRSKNFKDSNNFSVPFGHTVSAYEPNDSLELLVGLDSGLISHHSFASTPARPPLYSPFSSLPLCSGAVTSIAPSPFLSTLFLAGYDSGVVALFTAKEEKPLATWLGGKRVEKIIWSRQRAVLFYVLDQQGNLHTIDIIRDTINTFKPSANTKSIWISGTLTIGSLSSHKIKTILVFADADSSMGFYQLAQQLVETESDEKEELKHFVQDSLIN